MNGAPEGQVALSLGGPVTYISPEERMAVEKMPGDTQRGWGGDLVLLKDLPVSASDEMRR